MRDLTYTTTIYREGSEDQPTTLAAYTMTETIQAILWYAETFAKPILHIETVIDPGVSEGKVN